MRVHLTIVLVIVIAVVSPAQEAVISEQVPVSETEWARIEASVDRALAWLADQQQGDGSFPSRLDGQPAVTSLCAMAFLARGHLPGEGPYGAHIDRAIDYVLASQNAEGIIARIPGNGHNATYNHAISSVMLCEVYGMNDPDQSKRIHDAIGRALGWTLGRQQIRRRNPNDQGGWRYLNLNQKSIQADLSITSWHLMFLRAARNAGFDVPVESIDGAMAYMKRLYHPRTRTFNYALGYRHLGWTTRAMTGAGILSLSLAGEHETEMARSAANWVLTHGFDQYNRQPESGNDNDAYHYGAYYCSLAMFQVGGRYWREFYPRLARTLLANQDRRGHWAVERACRDHTPYGNAYTTALTVMALCVPCQLVPIYQR